ncbi:hypothetical protein VTK56DRAFT_6271 [Thermocarpiscus australiensis]
MLAQERVRGIDLAGLTSALTIESMLFWCTWHYPHDGSSHLLGMMAALRVRSELRAPGAGQDLSASIGKDVPDRRAISTLARHTRPFNSMKFEGRPPLRESRPGLRSPCTANFVSRYPGLQAFLFRLPAIPTSALAPAV